MSLRSLTDQGLVLKLKGLVAEERRIASEVLEYLAEVDRRRLYADFGCASLWEFCTHELGYSGGAAYRRIAAMRLSREVPEVKADLLQGGQNLSSLAQVQRFIRVERKVGPVSVERKRAVLAAVHGKTARECERTLLGLSSNPQAMIFGERVRSVDVDRVELKVVIDEELMDKLKRIRALRSNATPVMNYAELLSFMADEVLKKLEKRTKAGADAATNSLPVQKQAAGASDDAGLLPTPEVKVRFGRFRVAARRSPLPKSIVQQVWARDKSRCIWRHPKSGKSCGATHFLEVDHIRPVSLGGDNSPENLRLLCRAHNQRRAIPARN